MDRLQDMLLVFMLLAAPLIFYTKGNDVFEFNKLTALRFAGSLSAIVFAARALLSKRQSITRSPLDWPVLAWLMVCVVATVNTVNLRLSVHGVYEDFEGLTTWVNYGYLFWFTQQHVRTRRQIHLVVGAVIIAGAVAGFYGILQNFRIDFVPWDPATYSVTRMFSTMGNPNFLAAYLVMSLPLTLAVFLDLDEKIRTDKNVCITLIGLGFIATLGIISLFNIKYLNLSPEYYEVGSVAAIFGTQKFWAAHLLPLFPLAAAGLMFYGRLKLILLVSMIFQVVAIAFTKSRGGGISMLVVGFIFTAYFIWENRRSSSVLRQNIKWIVGFCVLVVLAHFNSEIRETTFHMVGRIWDLTDPQNFKLTPRLYIWRSALQMWADRLAFGWGLDTFQVVFSQYRTALYWNLEWNGTPEKAHNVVLQTAATMGTAGLIAFFWILIAYAGKTLKDLKELLDSRHRLLVVACFAASAAFLVQDLFSFTVVGYGSLFWVLLGFGPAMSRTWLAKEEKGPGEGTPLLRGGVNPNLVAVVLVAAVLVWFGSSMDMPQGGVGTLRKLLAAAALLGLGMHYLGTRSGRGLSPINFGMMAIPVFLGFFFFSLHSVRTWSADSFYKQGQIGNKIGRWDYAVNMLSKAAGKLKAITPEQVQAMLSPELAPAALQIQITPGLSPDQELYWVKQGISYEAGGAAQTDAKRKEQFYLTALALHQKTIEMSPVNGYNYNNKARTLKTMGEQLNNTDFFKMARDHYDKGLGLDPNNFYFNIEAINNDINLSERTGDKAWMEKAFEKCQALVEGFPNVALPYSYRGFIELRKAGQFSVAGQKKKGEEWTAMAAESFRLALKKDWKGDASSRGLAGANLAMLAANEGRLLSAAGKSESAAKSFSESAAAYKLAADTFPDNVQHRLNQAKMQWSSGDRTGGCQSAALLQGKIDPGQFATLRTQMGCR